MKIQRYALVGVFVLTLAACGDDGGGDEVDAASSQADATASTADASGGSADAAAVDSAASAMTLTSSAITNGGAFPLTYACTAHGGSDISPPLSWTGAPAGTMAYALVFLDTSNSLTHAAMWDIPVATTSLPEDVEKVYEPSEVAGAKQARAWHGQWNGYAGPCPGKPHLYRFTIHAVNVATLAGLNQSSSAGAAASAIEAASLGSATLEATFDPNQ